jgi:hypothetical protein
MSARNEWPEAYRLDVGRRTADAGQRTADLQALLNEASRAKDVYWQAAEAVERYLGIECEDLDLCTADFVEMTAAELLALAGNNKEGESK